jgi:hypothetical protein
MHLLETKQQETGICKLAHLVSTSCNNDYLIYISSWIINIDEVNVYEITMIINETSSINAKKTWHSM